MMFGRWVEINDEAPPAGKHVLILDKYGVMIVGKRKPSPTGDDYDYQWDKYSGDEFVFPEYWTELPPLPDKDVEARPECKQCAYMVDGGKHYKCYVVGTCPVATDKYRQQYLEKK